MLGKLAAPAIVAGLFIAASGTVSAQERYDDAVGDATGDAPDIVAVTVSEPEGPLLRFSVELDSGPSLIADEERMDMLWLVMDTEPDVAFPELDGYSIVALGVTFGHDLESGGHLLVGEDLYWGVVDVAVDGAAVIFSVDRKLLGDPTELHFRVSGSTLRGSLYTEEMDVYPDEGEPAAAFTLQKESD